MKKINNAFKEPICSQLNSALLQAFGFNMKTEFFYVVVAKEDENYGKLIAYEKGSFSSKTCIKAPTQSQAKLWLLINFGWFIEIDTWFEEDGVTVKGYSACSYRNAKDKIQYEMNILNLDLESTYGIIFQTIEEATNTAIYKILLKEQVP